VPAARMVSAAREGGELPAGVGHPAEPPGKGVLLGGVVGGKQRSLLNLLAALK